MASFSVQMPYEGNEKFIFVSYSHNNKTEAESFIGRLQQDGYRVWYDEGIHPGSEWDEFIATHVENCELFFALMSEEYIKSENCRDELNFARDLNKNRVLIFLDEVELPAGMRLRLGRLQNIHKKQYTDEEKFYQKVYLTEGIEESHIKRGIQESDANEAMREPERNKSGNQTLPQTDSALLDSITERSTIYQERIIKRFTDSATNDGIRISLEVFPESFRVATIGTRYGVSNEIKKSVTKGIRRALKHGPIAGGEVKYLSVQIENIEYSLNDSLDLKRFENAGKMVCREILKTHQNDLRLYEPIAAIRLHCSDNKELQQEELQKVGNIIEINQKRAVIHVPYRMVKTAENELREKGFVVENVRKIDFEAVDRTNTEEIQKEYLTKMFWLKMQYNEMIKLQMEIARLNTKINDFKLLQNTINTYNNSIDRNNNGETDDIDETIERMVSAFSTDDGNKMWQQFNELHQKQLKLLNKKQKELNKLEQEVDDMLKDMFIE